MIQVIDGKFDTVKLKKGKHWTVCSKCGNKALRYPNAKQCHMGGAWYAYGRYDCYAPIEHMPETCKLLGGACK
jgi:hypothetical protein